ncbi:tetratricopeptide repeat protein [Aquimarina sp. MAR_2010_214]|uniref:tetratricopeptide repeat protein n=1 Tax=Aquimarina sp. MAR_2010_214 TaxID=1250026 RepID=UPI000CBF29D8|nr:tetratricopeptide repeat protein [Aquimarina sp. MAR_2010_214]PKV49794.1 tetratricopeptide repeat protein [Aquimarina sp. MAR_2010_214]
MNTSKKKKTLYFVIVMIIITTITYLNHFNNSFHFDDIHTITQNPNIRSLKNIPVFFSDGTTFSSLPQNQSYRPIVSTSLALDYWLGNGYNMFYFHLTSFILFLLQGFLIFLFTYKILDISYPNPNNFYITAILTLWYMLHPVMAETINYIIARSDLQSTFFVLLAFVLYQYSNFSRKTYLYILPIILGALAKPTAVMFAPLFLFYTILFDQKISILKVFSLKNILTLIKKVTPIFVSCLLIYLFTDYMTPKTFSTGSTEVFRYLISQPFVILYYFGSLFLPIHLSADTDWILLENIWSYNFLIGFVFIIILLYIALITSKQKKYRPISFGILWFFISLAPTSSFIPLAEVMNDHRMFFPYVGLIISVGWSFLLLIKYVQKKYQLNKWYIITPIFILISVYAFGTYQRNEVWHNDENLWKDVTIKSPKNARGLMNYGITKMEKGDYDSAEVYFKKALIIKPYYPFLHINLGILYSSKGNKTIAEEYYKKATEYGVKYYSSWFYYGKFLWQENRNQESIEKLSKSLELSPNSIETRIILMENYLELEDWRNLNKIASSTLEIDRNNNRVQLFLLASIEKTSKLEAEEKRIANQPTATKYFNLSFKYYQKKQYSKSISIAEKAITLNSNYTEAYNNICSAYTILGDYNKAIEACNKALKLNPNYQLAKNNLKNAHNHKAKTEYQINLLKKDPTEANYLNLSLLYYNNKLFEKCIKIAEEGVLKHPNSDKLYNNICTSYNALKEWNKAFEAGKKGLAINPNNQLLRNNYNVTLKNIKN